jgi:hypothetical protein
VRVLRDRLVSVDLPVVSVLGPVWELDRPELGWVLPEWVAPLAALAHVLAPVQGLQEWASVPRVPEAQRAVSVFAPVQERVPLESVSALQVRVVRPAVWGFFPVQAQARRVLVWAVPVVQPAVLVCVQVPEQAPRAWVLVAQV